MSVNSSVSWFDVTVGGDKVWYVGRIILRMEWYMIFIPVEFSRVWLSTLVALASDFRKLDTSVSISRTFSRFASE